MGDRVSIQFVGGNESSAILFDHWGGTDFPKKALEFAKKMKKDMGDRVICDPAQRMEGGIVMLNFILHELRKDVGDLDFSEEKMKRKGNYLTSSYYIMPTVEDGDNSDNGHYIIDCDSLTVSGGYDE